MIKKVYSKTGKSCRVTFKFKPPGDVQTVNLCGEFNEWDKQQHTMKLRKDGSFSTTISLEPGAYRFRYLLNGARWESDPEADDDTPNPFGETDSVVNI